MMKRTTLACVLRLDIHRDPSGTVKKRYLNGPDSSPSDGPNWRNLTIFQLSKVVTAFAGKEAAKVIWVFQRHSEFLQETGKRERIGTS